MGLPVAVPTQHPVAGREALTPKPSVEVVASAAPTLGPATAVNVVDGQMKDTSVAAAFTLTAVAVENFRAKLRPVSKRSSPPFFFGHSVPLGSASSEAFFRRHRIPLAFGPRLDLLSIFLVRLIAVTQAFPTRFLLFRSHLGFVSSRGFRRLLSVHSQLLAARSVR